MAKRGAARGSDVLLERWKRGVGIDDEVVNGIVEATKDLDIDLRDILIKGQPRPDFLRASAVTGDPDRVGAVVGGVLGALQRTGGGGFPVIRVFPRGIPRPDQFVVDITIGQPEIGT